MSTVSGLLASKRLEVLKDALPSIRRVAVITSARWRDPTASAYRQWVETESAAQRLGLTPVLAEVQDGATMTASISNLEQAMADAIVQRPDAVTVLGDSLVDLVRSDIARVANQNGLPSMHTRADFTDSGGLMAYGPNLTIQAKRAAVIVDRLIKGASPADIPVELPSVFDLAINLRTARALGIEIPATLTAQATRLVQ
jgi:putative ABC transport system substrate-binding protein